jgi:hypothetical protein
MAVLLSIVQKNEPTPQNTGDLQIYSTYSIQVWPTPEWVQNFNFEALKVLEAKKQNFQILI